MKILAFSVVVVFVVPDDEQAHIRADFADHCSDRVRDHAGRWDRRDRNPSLAPPL
jgi:hypothetical protein